MTLFLREDFHSIVHKKLRDETNVKDRNKKMYKNYLATYSTSIPESLKGMTQATEEHKLKKKYLQNQLIKIKIEPLITCMYKLIAKLMTGDENYDIIPNTHMQQFQNKINDFDKVIKLLTNNDNNVPR